METATQEGVVATFWFDPGLLRKVDTVTVRFTGRRVGVTGKPQPTDRFVRDERIEGVVSGAGPVSVTARVHGITPGEWMVTAEMLSLPRVERGQRGQVRTAAPPQPVWPAAWSWRRWALSRGAVAPMKTGFVRFALIPGIIPGFWAGMATLGVLIGLVLQALMVSRAHISVGGVLPLSVVAILSGFVGAKVWFLVLHRRDRKIDGWCIQGFLVGFVAVSTAGLVVSRLPIPVLLDASAPGLFLGLAAGRVGCFCGGCCFGRATASRWGVWSSDQRVGMRRIPTQLIESGLALSVGLVALVVVLRYGSIHGGVFVAALAAYTLFRQGILQLRAERRQSALVGPLVAAAAALGLMADVVLLAVRPPWLP